MFTAEDAEVAERRPERDLQCERVGPVLFGFFNSAILADFAVQIRMRSGLTPEIFNDQCRMSNEGGANRIQR